MFDTRGWLQRFRHSLSAKLLILTILFVMISEVLIFTPSIARFRLTYLQEKIGVAHIASLALEATPTHMLSPQLEMQLMQYVDAYSIVLDMRGKARMLVMNRDMPPVIDDNYDLRTANFASLVVDAFRTLAHTGYRVLRVVGPSPKDPGIMVELVLDEGPLRRAMWDFAGRILKLSIVISLITAGLVYFTMQWLLVRPMQRITDAMQTFRTNPEDARNVIAPSAREDEIGVAERELARMQTDLRAALHQKSRLAALGAAVTKISHDLRNILATAQLVSDRLADSRDPTVRRTTPTLIASLDRAIALCVNTMRFAKDDQPQPAMSRFALDGLVADVGATLAPQAPEGCQWANEVPSGLIIHADRDQIFRVLVNLGRNAYEAGATRISVSAKNGDGGVTVEVADNGKGIAPVAREKLFQPFSGTAKAGGTGLGLVIVRDLLRAHGGDIRLAETRPGETRFLLTLPITRQAAE
ncbi:MAG TPA: HAMP domain-containing sensor histidine kinase [Alphaproteobacteria bacterium]|nr:HAMP domain-containing sensor histidine kinase [Alphaproteobacteria bacterium]